MRRLLRKFICTISRIRFLEWLLLCFGQVSVYIHGDCCPQRRLADGAGTNQKFADQYTTQVLGRAAAGKSLVTHNTSFDSREQAPRIIVSVLVKHYLNVTETSFQ